MTTSLELGCDCLGEIRYLDAVVHDAKGAAAHDPQRDLHPRGGRRRALEARGPRRRRRDAPRAAAGRVLPRDRGQLRVPRLLALLPGRQHRVPRARHRDHGHHPLPGGRAAALRHAGGRAHLRAAAPALPRGAARHGRGRRGQHGPHDRVGGAPDGPGQPRRARHRAAQHPAAHRGGGQAGLPLGDPARLEGGQRERAQRPRHPDRLQARARRRLPGDARPGLARLPPRAGDRPHALGHPLRARRALALRGVPRSGRGGRRPAGLDRAEPLDREHRRGALVRVRAAPRHASRGVAGDARGQRVVLAQAGRASSTATPRSTCRA